MYYHFQLCRVLIEPQLLWKDAELRTTFMPFYVADSTNSLRTEPEFI